MKVLILLTLSERVREIESAVYVSIIKNDRNNKWVVAYFGNFLFPKACTGNLWILWFALNDV